MKVVFETRLLGGVNFQVSIRSTMRVHMGAVQDLIKDVDPTLISKTEILIVPNCQELIFHN